MKRVLIVAMVAILGVSLVACSAKEPSTQNELPEKTSGSQEQEEPNTEKTEDIEESGDESELNEESEQKQASKPEGDIIEIGSSTKDNPIPMGTWAQLTITDGGWPKTAYARVVNVSDEQNQVQSVIDGYNTTHPNDSIEPLEEHAEFLDYVLVEYEVYFPTEFTESSNISFSGMVMSRNNNQEDWIASDGSNYYWMGAVTNVEVPTLETGYPVNGDTVTCKLVYPMIKNYTDYTLLYKERTEDLTETIETYFAIQ